MSLYNLEQELAKLCRKELSDLYKKQLVNVWGSTGRDIRDPDAPLGIYFYDESGVNSIVVKNDFNSGAVLSLKGIIYVQSKLR